MIGCTILIGLLGWIKKDPHYTSTWMQLVVTYFTVCDPILMLLAHFSPPSWLTLGRRIGGFAPTSCETSKLIWGPPSLPLPCQALDFKIWLSNVSGPDGWRYLIRP
jgi:hypothetical protein